MGVEKVSVGPYHQQTWSSEHFYTIESVLWTVVTIQPSMVLFLVTIPSCHEEPCYLLLEIANFVWIHRLPLLLGQVLQFVR